MDLGTAPLPPDDREFARLVAEQGLCSRERIDECVEFIARLVAQGVTPVPRLAELLVRKGYLTPTDATLRPSSGGGTARVEPRLPAEAAQAALDPANQLGRYVKVTLLGAGGMGEVWKGWDRELGRWVALKFLHKADPEQDARLRREAQTAAALNHPHIASVYGVGVKNEAPFIAMQYIDGQTLATFPRKDPRVLVGLLRDAALAVQHAHDQGIIHRDLKPANLMVGSGRVFVMDFGLAKATSVDASHSVSGSIVGTPAYMSPEQARGRTAAISRETDVYSLGATLYELLADRPPFRSRDLYDLLAKVVEEDPAPLRRIRPSIDRDLETIVLKCLEKQPARRYRSAQELADDLDRWLRGEPLHAHPPSALYHVRKFLGRRKALVAIGAAGLAGVCVALGLLVPRWLHERTLKELAPLRTQIAVIREWVRQPFRGPDEIRRALQAEIDGVSDYIRRHPGFPQGHFVRAQAHLYLGDLEAAGRDAREALRLDPGFLPAWTLLGRVQLETYAGLLTADSADLFKVRDSLARAVLAEAAESLRRGHQAQSVQSEIEAWGLARTRDDAVSAALAEALHLYYVQGSREEALRRLEEAHRASPSEEYLLWSSRWSKASADRELRIRRMIEMAPVYAPGHVERGTFLLDQGKNAEAIQAYADAIARDARSSSAYIGRGLARGVGRDYRGAVADFTRVLELDRRNTSAYVYRAAARSMDGDDTGAMADCDKALEIHPGSVGALINRSLARRNRKDFAGALEDLSRVDAINPKLALTWTNRAGVRQQMGDVRGALADCDRALEIDGGYIEAHRLRGAILRDVDPKASVQAFTTAIERTSSVATPFRANLIADRALSRMFAGDLAGGLADAQEAVRLNPEGDYPQLQLGTVLLARGDIAGSIPHFDRAIERNPRSSDAWTGRAQARLALGRLEESIADATRAVENNPDDFAALMVRATALQKRGDDAGAEKDCTRVLELKPDTALALLTRSYSRARMGRFPEAAGDAERASALFPTGTAQQELARRCLTAFRAGKLP